MYQVALTNNHYAVACEQIYLYLIIKTDIIFVYTHRNMYFVVLICFTFRCFITIFTHFGMKYIPVF